MVCFLMIERYVRKSALALLGGEARAVFSKRSEKIFGL